MKHITEQGEWFLAEIRRRFGADELRAWYDPEDGMHIYRMTCPDVVLTFKVADTEMYHARDLKALFTARLDALEEQLK